MIKRIGIKNSPVFLQGFYDAGEFRMYDPGMRFPGDEFTNIIKASTGLDMMKSMILYSLTGDSCLDDELLDKAYRMNGCSGALLLVSVRPGIITRFDGLDKVAKLPSTVSVVQMGFPGNKIEKTGDVRQRVCEIAVMVNGDKQTLHQAVRKTESCLHIEDEKGDPMITSLFDPDKLIQ